MKKKPPSFPLGHYYEMAKKLTNKNIMKDSRGRIYEKDPKTGVIRRLKNV